MRRRKGGLYKENCPRLGYTARWFDWQSQDRFLWYEYVNLYEKLHPLNISKDKQIVIVNKLPFRGRIIYVISYFDCILIKVKIQWNLCNSTPEYSDILYNPKHFPMPLVYRIRQVPLHNNNKIIIAVTIMQKENPGINKYLVVVFWFMSCSCN